jgi:hypothetical protein
MANDPQSVPPLFTQYDVSANASASNSDQGRESVGNVLDVLQDLLAAQDRQNQLLEELVSQMGTVQRQRALELGQWKEANPDLSRGCRRAAEWLSQAQTEYLRTLTAEVNESADELAESNFMLNELVDRYGPRFAHLNGMLQVLSQLGNASNSSNRTEN